MKPTPSVYETALGLVLQGAKQAMISDRPLRYNPAYDSARGPTQIGTISI
jgi:hypothetical protein